MELIDATCPFCLDADAALDTALMLFGPERTAEKKRLERAAASPDGVLTRHWRHLRTSVMLPASLEQPAPDADPIEKTRWTQTQLFRLTFGADEILPDDSAEQIALLRTKQVTLGTLLGAVRLEAELLGQIEKAKIKGKRRGEREMAKEEMVEERLMSPEEQMTFYAATLRLNGFEVNRTVAEAIDVTEKKA
jgi:hypothetical protein